MYMIIQTALVAKEIFLKELGSVIPRLQDEKTLPVLTSFAMDSTTLYSWVWLLSSGNCLYLSFTFHDWKIGLLSGYPTKLVRISKLTVPRAETAVELDVYGVFGILRGNSVADQDDFIRETDFCGH